MTLGLGFGMARRQKKIGSHAALPAAPAGTVWASDYRAGSMTPYWNGGTKIRIWNRTWYLDNAQRGDYAFGSADNQVARFEVRQGDQFVKSGFSDSTGTTRNKIVLWDNDWFSPTFKYRAIGKVTVADGLPSTSTFFTVMERHTFGSAFMLAADFELIIRNGFWGVTAGYNPTTTTTDTRTLWDNTIPGANGTLAAVKGQTYNIDIFWSPDPTGSTGRVRVAIDGVVYVNFVGKVGFINTTQVAPELGIYRGLNNPAEPAVVLHDWTTLDWSTSLVDPGAPVETLGPELAGARQPFTNATGITAQNATTVWNTPNAGYLNITNTIISGNTHGRFNITTEVGAQYKLVLVGRNFTSNNFRAAVLGSTLDVNTGNSTATTDTTLTLYFTADSTTTTVFMHNESFTTSKVAGVKSVSVKKVT